jgi:hypothetical protein
MTVPTGRLPGPTPLILKTLLYFRQATTSQIRRLHYDGTERGCIVRTNRHLKRLTALDMVKRVWGVYLNVPEYVYLPADAKARNANMHTLDILELYVRLIESKTNSVDGLNIVDRLIFDPEPWRWYNVGPTLLKPDAFIDTGRRFFLEMDRGTEFRSALQEKLRRYRTAYDVWDEERFPQVLFVCHDEDRLRFIERVIRAWDSAGLVQVCLMDDAVEVLTR